MAGNTSDRSPKSTCARLLSRAARLLGARLSLHRADLTLLGGQSLLDDPSHGAGLRDLAREALAARTLLERRMAGCFSAFAIPASKRDQVVVLIALVADARPSGRHLARGTRRDLRGFLQALARSAAEELASTEVRRGASERLSALEAEASLLRRVSERLADPADAREALRFILDEGRAACAADIGLVVMSGSRMPIISRGAQLAQLDQPAVPVLRRIGELLAERFEGARLRSMHGSAGAMFGAASPLPAPTQIAAGRIRLGNRRGGYMALIRSGCMQFAMHETRLLETLCGQASLALRGGEMYADLQKFLLQTVKTLVGVIEQKDDYTSGHSARVHVLAMLLARECGLPRRQHEALKWASILHDVGKIGLSEAILSKAGRLTAAEYEIVQNHPRRGYELLRHIPQLRDAAQAVLLHHERIDGQGYPLGLAGDAIPLPARIIAVADTFDALTTTRPYRAAQPAADAFAEIERVAGQQLDRDVAAALGRMLPLLSDRRLMQQPLGEELREAA